MENPFVSNSSDDTLLEALRRLPRAEPDAGLPERFAMRARQLPDHRRSQWPLAIAAGLILVLGAGWWQEHRARAAEVVALRSELEAAMQDVSAARRLVAMNEIGQAKIGDSEVVALLTVVLLTDESPSVRMAAVEALSRGADQHSFATAVNQSLASESSALVQTALLRSLDRLGPEDRSKMLAAFLTRTDIEPIVRADAKQLTSI